MKIFRCAFSKQEMASDAFRFEEALDGMCIKFEAKYVNKVEGDIGVADNSEGAVGGDEAGERVINLVDNHKLTEIEYSLKDWMGYVKGVVPKLVEMFKTKATEEGRELEADEVKAYKKKCVAFVNFIKNDFDNIQIFGDDLSEIEGDVYSLGYGINEDTEDYDKISIYMLNDCLIEEKY